MGWGSGKIKRAEAIVIDNSFVRSDIVSYNVDWQRIVTLDFETYFDDDYTLRKQTTSEYVRDKRFKAQMVGIKVGRGKTKWYGAKDLKKAIQSIDWSTHSLLAHHAHFDGLILSHHFDVHPVFIFDTLSMARALYSNEIGAGLDEVSKFTGGPGKIDAGVLDQTRGVLNWSPALEKRAGVYCVGDVDETFRIFCHMLPRFPSREIEIVDVVVKMYTEPTLQLDRPLAKKVLAHEIAEKRRVMLQFSAKAESMGVKLTSEHRKKIGPNATEEDTAIIKARVMIGSTRFVDLLREKGIDPPIKVSPSWLAKPKHERDDAKKYTWAFSKTDLPFIELLEHIDPEVRDLVEARLSSRSNTNETRAARFLKLNEGGMPLPVYIKYSAAHTHRLGGGDRTNFQNLKRGGDLRKSLQAPKGHMIGVQDSGQIEARINGWLWGQDDLVENFRIADRYEASIAHLPKKQRPMATGLNRDAYCKFGDDIYGREITKKDDEERFISKTCILGLGYQMSAPRLKNTLAIGAGGPKVFLDDAECERIVRTYRTRNRMIVNGWKTCQRIIEQMAEGISGSYKCISWEKDTLWLPNGMCMHYPNLHDKRISHMVAKKLNPELFEDDDIDLRFPQYVYQTKGGSEVKIYGGKLCVSAYTEVLTDSGWKQIVDVQPIDRVWDGIEWVSHAGVDYRGTKQTINFGGVFMTPDHKVNVDGKWIEAQHTSHGEATSSCARHYGAATAHADRSVSVREHRHQDAMGCGMLVWESDPDGRNGILEGQAEIVRLRARNFDQQVSDITRDEPTSDLSRMAQHDRALHIPDAQGVGKLRWAWDCSGQEVAEVRELLEGHVSNIQIGADTGTQQQRDGVLQSELHLGDVQTASEQQARTKEVYDLIDAGPRHRFTVRGDNGQPFIVHNCENIVQALARIIVMEQMLDISKITLRGMRAKVVMSTHDEVACVLKKSVAEAATKAMHTIMKTPPWWAPDLPLNSEGVLDTYYAK